ncbi:MAG: N-acetylglucosamine-6-phosphate deacetylase [Halioglobus sp.]|jgi:N-acetylglucosamine-6-phosphate deacetylase
MTFAIQAQRIFDGDRLLEHHAVLIEDDRIVKVIPNGEIPADIEIRQLVAGTLAPGFIDIQVNGGGGVMLNNSPCRQTVDTMVAAHRATGTTSMMPTLISDTRDNQQAGIEAVRDARAHGNAGVLGIHIEGPFFNPAKRGTHKASMIRSPAAQDIDWLSSLADLNVIVTLAPDQVQPGQIKQLANAGVHVCAGHTNASYEQIMHAIAEGLQGFTHVFNAMSPLVAREPGTVGAALDSDNTWVGVIADGHHVHPANIRIAQRMKPAGKLLLVTDAMATVGSEDSFFEIYGERIEELDGRLINSEGSLAGSAIGMIDGVRFMNSSVGLPLEECLRMAALYPAVFLELDHELGRIASGYRADFVHFDEDFRVRNTWVAGAQQTH